jgi:2-methylcitrate dehydratase PrpD
MKANNRSSKQLSRQLSRRSLLKSAGVITAASAFPRLMQAADPVVGLVMRTLSEYMAAANGRALPADVMTHAKLHILDTFAAMISGTQLAPGRFALNYARLHPGEKIATVLGSNALCGATDAAQVNGILGHSDETDDYAPTGTHPGCAIVPAALATAEQYGCDGMRFVRSIVLGYDVCGRMAPILGAQNFNYQYHRSIHTATATFGSAAAAASIAGLNVQQMRWVMDYASQQSSGIAAWQRDTDHIEKGFVYAGIPARNGVTATLMVQAGATGVDDVFSGRDNYFDAYAPPGAKPEGMIEKLGESFDIVATTIKKWTVGGPAQAALDALEILLKRKSFTADQVQKLIVKLGPSMGSVVDNRDMPDVNVQHMLSVMLIDKTASFAAAHDKPRMKDPAVLKQRAKVQLMFEPALEPNLEARQAIVEITLTDGTQLSEHVKAVRGTPANPMTQEEIVKKARDLVTPVLGAAKTGKLIDSVLSIEKMKSVGDLRPMLQVG